MILDRLPDLGITGITHHSNTLDDSSVDKVRGLFGGKQVPKKRDYSSTNKLLDRVRKSRHMRPSTIQPLPVRETKASEPPSISSTATRKSAFRPPFVLKVPLAKKKTESREVVEENGQPTEDVQGTVPVIPVAAPSLIQEPELGKEFLGTASDVTQYPETDTKPEPPVNVDMGPEVQRPVINQSPGLPPVPHALPTVPEQQPKVLRALPRSPIKPTPAEPSTPQYRPIFPPGPPRDTLPNHPIGIRKNRLRPPVASPTSSRQTPGQPLVDPGRKFPRSGGPTNSMTPGQPQPFERSYGDRPQFGTRFRPSPAGGDFGRGRPPSPAGPGPKRPPSGGRRPTRPQHARDMETAISEGKIRAPQRVQEPVIAVNTEIFAADGTTIKELAEKLGIKAKLIAQSLFEKGQRVTINQPLDLDHIKEISIHFGATATELTFEEETVLDLGQDEGVMDIEPRAPVVTVMGHVDHGKTSLLDAIRTTNVASREAGGITQAIGAYQVEKDGKRIVFIDTPGHEAFTKMRAQGASVTDIVILVVAADDGVMPQTLEAIDHAKAAKAPIIVAVNKIDVAKADPERVSQQLSDRGLVPEDWGGDTIFCKVSAQTHEGIENLLEMVSLVAELKELKSNPSRSAIGVVLESKLDRGKGPVATLLTQNGTLHVGDTFVVGSVLGRVRAMMDDRGKRVKEAGPSSAVVVLGLDDLPEPGDQLSVISDTDRAKKIVDYREKKEREQAITKTSRLSLEQFREQIASGNIKELPIILKADMQGSTIVLRDTLAKLTSDKVKVRVIHAGVGAVKESDILLAMTAGAVVVGFNVRPERSASALATKEGIDIRLHTVIYELVDELKKSLAGLLDPIHKEEFLGRAKVLEIFHITNVGTVAGCKLEEGIALSSASARLVRDKVVVHTGKLDSLKRFKDDVKEVQAGQECGIRFARYNDVKQSDEIELFKIVEVAQDINDLIPV